MKCNMVVINEIWELVGVVTDLLPVFIVLSLIGLFLFFLSRMLGGGKLANRFRINLVIAMLLPFLLFTSVAPATASVDAVAITIDSNVVFGGSIATVKATGLTAATEYTLYATGNAETFNNVTFTAATATEYIPIGIPKETDLAFTLGISASTSGQGASSATYYVSLTEPDDFLPTGIFLDLIVPLILIGIFVGIALAVVGNKKRTR
ncbi:MAG: hypothetical protein ACXACY_23460 [Candidatus Hodarchaeales archaeon]